MVLSGVEFLPRLPTYHHIVTNAGATSANEAGDCPQDPCIAVDSGRPSFLE